MADVFISYAQEDRVLARELAKDLQDLGYSVWWDYYIMSGEDYRLAILKQLADAKAVIIIWSAHSVVSPFVIDEAGRAMEDNKAVLTNISGFDRRLLPLGFGAKHCVDLDDREQIVKALKKRGFVPDHEAAPILAAKAQQPKKRVGLSYSLALAALASVFLLVAVLIFGRDKRELALANGKYAGTRGYTVPKGDECKGEYKFNIDIMDGKIHFDSGTRYYVGDIDQQSGYIQGIDGKSAHPPTLTAFLVKGPYSDAKMTSDFCGEGYFRVNK